MKNYGRMEQYKIFQIGIILLLLCGLALRAGPVDAAVSLVERPGEQQQDTPRFEPAACMFDMPAGLQEGQDVDCGWLIVPEEYENPQGPTIRLAVAVLRSQAADPEPDPLVMAQGGPGGSTIDTYLQAIALIAPHLRANRDIILFDQRGTLNSEPALLCPEALDLTIEYLDQDLPDEEIYRLSLESMLACRDRLLDEGVNLSAFDSVENAADVESLRLALGYDQINLYGVSYGTLLAQHVMRLYPEGLRSVVLDSVVPTNVNFLTEAGQTRHRSFQGLFDACRRDESCNASYPNLEDVFYEQIERLNENPARVTLTDPETQERYPALIDGDTLRSAVFQMMYITDLIPFMPKVIYDARAGNFDFLARIYSVLVFDRTMSLGMYYTVMCAEDADFTPADVNVEGLPEKIAEDERTGGEFFLRTCEAWNVEPLGPEVDEPVTSEIPTLLLSGQLDPITPPEYADEVASRLPNHYSVVMPWGGHGSVTSTQCADNMMLEFLDNPNQAPDSSCVNALADIEFITRATLIRLPIIGSLMNLENGTAPQLLLYFLALLFLLTALVVYPIVWLVRLFSGQRPAPAAVPVQEPAVPDAASYDPNWKDLRNDAANASDVRRPGLYRFAPWLAVLTALLLLAFTILLVAVLVNLSLTFDYRILLGLPGSARPIFVLPVLAGLLTLVMLAAVVIGWSRRAGSAAGRIYFTLLSLAAVVCLAVLGIWGMLTGIVA